MMEDERSRFYYEYSKKKWEKYNVIIEVFDAVTPKTLYRHNDLIFSDHNQSIKYINNGIYTEYSDTEKSVFLSHYSLWKECAFLNKPLLILEHDTIPVNIKNFKYHKNSGIVFYDEGSMGCYIIQPWFAKKLVTHCIENVILAGPFAQIWQFTMDNSYYEYNISHRHKDYKAFCNQVMSRKYGNTIEHHCHSEEFKKVYREKKGKEFPEHNFIMID